MTAPLQLVRSLVAESYRPIGQVDIVNERVAGDYAAYAVTFSETIGRRRQGLIGLRNQNGVWRPWAYSMGGHYVGRGPAAGLWTDCGGWGVDSDTEPSVFGGWPADPATASVRMTDDAGRTLEDAVQGGAVIFIYRGDFRRTGSRVEFLSGNGDILGAT